VQIYLELILKTNNWKKMAVPKRKTSVSKRNMRRSHDSIKKINVILDKDSGEPRLSHKIDLSTGMYKGREILKKKTTENN
tara:strand:+ start:1749 stop:1988 length:240 start_codon:yes stop_codon:yes gene_type:complete